jgi:hypothetical protein
MHPRMKMRHVEDMGFRSEQQAASKIQLIMNHP